MFFGCTRRNPLGQEGRAVTRYSRKFASGFVTHHAIVALIPS
jgi:hypothetical protein